jgi:putative tricarboxylic transport membrane protein
MDPASEFLAGLQNVIAPEMLVYALIGCVIGLIVGILPGFGPAAATALLFPLSFSLGPTASLVMMAAVLYGATYGGSITAVLLRVPGEASSVPTTLDGHALAKAGRAGPALVVAALGGFVGCMVAVVGFVGATPLTRVALTLGPVEMFALTILALLIAASLVGRSVTRGLVAVALELLLSTVGRDPLSGVERFTGGIGGLGDGLDIIPDYGPVRPLGTVHHRRAAAALAAGGRRRAHPPLACGPQGLCRSDGARIGHRFLLRTRPRLARRDDRVRLVRTGEEACQHPERFGQGAIQGVAGPESANNALSVASMIPLFTLGIPSSATMAIMFGVFTSNGLIPGPRLFTDNPEVAWTILASILVGNAILLVLNVPLVRLWVQVLKTPYPVLYTVVVVFLVLGAYSLRNSIFDVFVLLVSGFAGYVFGKIDIPASAIALTLVLGPLMETAFRQSMALSHGNPIGLFSSATAVVVYAIAAAPLIGIPVSRRVRGRQRLTTQHDEPERVETR